MSVTIQAVDKPQALEQYPMTGIHRRQIDELMNDTERKLFMSINATLGWLEITESPWYSFYSSYLQQDVSDC